MISSFFFIKYNFLLFIGRFISGLSHGLIHLVVIIHTSDNVSKRSRGAILRSISYVLAFSLMIAIVTNASHGIDFERTNISVGIYTLGYAIFALVLIPSATNESIPFLIMHHREEFAIQKYVQLRSERVPTPQTKQGFELIKNTVLADRKYNANIFARDNLKPLGLITGARLLSLFLTNIPIMIFLLDNIFKNPISPQKLIWLQSARIIFGFIPIFIAAPNIRNQIIYKLAIGCGVILFVLQTVFTLSTVLTSILSYTAMFFYLVTTIGIDAIQYVQAAEAFPLTTKQYSLAFIAVVENIIHILLIVLYHYHLVWVMVYICAIGLILLGIALNIYMPNISALSICDARIFYK